MGVPRAASGNDPSAAHMSDETIDLARLARAVHLDVERAGDAWLVSGGALAHVVSLDAAECDCFGYGQRRTNCKHILAARLRLGDPETLSALRLMIPMPTRSRCGGVPLGSPQLRVTMRETRGTAADAAAHK